MTIAYSINGIIMICAFCNLAFGWKTHQQSLQVLSEQSPDKSWLTQTMAEGQLACPYGFIYVFLDKLYWSSKEKKKPRSVKLLLLFHFCYFSLKSYK